VKDQARADALLDAMRTAERVLRETTEERVRLALEGYEEGLTLDAIGEALGVSNVAVGKWVRAAKDQETSHSR
jgi:DNA-binding transcriptional regulator LsrR (DeoR family)